MIRTLIIFGITLYQKTLSPQTGVFRFLYRSPLVSLCSCESPGCRFYPRCSDYTKQALKTHSLLRAVILSFRRILRCHGGSAGGVDPVPHKKKKESNAPKLLTTNY